MCSSLERACLQVLDFCKVLWEEGEVLSGWEGSMIFMTPCEEIHPFPQLRKSKLQAKYLAKGYRASS